MRGFTVIIIYDTILRQKQNFKHEKLNSTVSPSRYCGMNRQCFAAARLTWPAYDDGRKREESSV